MRFTQESIKMFWLIIFAVTWVSCKALEVFEHKSEPEPYEFEFLKWLEDNDNDKE